MPCEAGRRPGIAGRDRRHPLGEVDRRACARSAHDTTRWCWRLATPDCSTSVNGWNARGPITTPASEGRCCFLIAERQRALVALAPLVLRTERWSHARRRVLGFIGGTWDELDNWMPAFLFATSDATRAGGDHGRVGGRHRAESRGTCSTCGSSGTRAPVMPSCARDFPALRATPDRLTTPRARLERRLGSLLVRQKQAADAHGRAGPDACRPRRPEHGARSDRERPGRATRRGRGHASCAAAAGSGIRTSAQFPLRGSRRRNRCSGA